MNIFERIKFRYYVSKKYTFRVHVGEYYKNKKYYREKVLQKKGFVKAKIVDGCYTLWCNPNRITLKLGYEEDIIPYNDNSITSKVKSYIPINVCKECLENKKCKKYSDYLDEKIKRTVLENCLKDRCKKYLNLIDQEKQKLSMRENCLKEGLK